MTDIYGRKAAALLLILLGLAAGYAAAYLHYSPTLDGLRRQLEEARENAAALAARLGEAQRRASQLESRLAALNESCSSLNASYAELRRNYTALRGSCTELEEYLKSLHYEEQELSGQLRDVTYYRGFTLYLYRTGGTGHVYVYIPARDYLSLRRNTTAHTRATIENRFTTDYIRDAVYSYRTRLGAPVRRIAAQLKELSRGDPELYANLALQLVHELAYRPTLYTKYPLETLVEGSGDCDNLAVLLASILSAGGYDTLVILVKYTWPNGTTLYHAVTAVALPEPPRDLERLGIEPAYIPLYGENFYYAEATWGTPGTPGYTPPNTPHAYGYPQAYVGVFTAPANATAELVDYVYIRALPTG